MAQGRRSTCRGGGRRSGTSGGTPLVSTLSCGKTSLRWAEGCFSDTRAWSCERKNNWCYPSYAGLCNSTVIPGARHSARDVSRSTKGGHGPYHEEHAGSATIG